MKESIYTSAVRAFYDVQNTTGLKPDRIVCSIEVMAEFCALLAEHGRRGSRAAKQRCAYCRREGSSVRCEGCGAPQFKTETGKQIWQFFGADLIMNSALAKNEMRFENARTSQVVTLEYRR